jgi:YVTN family beta-propeller protein
VLLNGITPNATTPLYQLQEDYQTLLPLPFGPLFSTSSLSAYNPSCTPNVFVYAVAFIDTATDTVTTLSTPQYNPYGVAISPDGSKAYVTSYSTNQPVIFQIDMATHQILPQTLQVNSYPKSIFLTPDGALAWVTFSQSSVIYVIDTLSMTVAATINAGGTADTGLDFTPDGTRAYVAVFGGSLAVFNTAASPNHLD